MSTSTTPATHFDSSPSSHLHKFFNSQAAEYDSRSKGTSRTIAKACVKYLEPLPQEAQIHDNASGPGILCSEVLAVHPDAHVTCTDNAQGMVDVVKGLIREREGWEGHVDAVVMSGEKLDFPNQTFDVSITNFGIFMFNTPEAGASEIHRTLKPAGLAIVTCWRDAGWPRILRAIQTSLFPSRPLFHNELMERWSEPETLVACLQAGGFGAVEVREEETAMWGREAEWEAWMREYAETMGSMVGEALTGEEKGRLEEGLRKLWEDEGRRWEYFVKGEEGTFGVRMRAWVGLATK